MRFHFLHFVAFNRQLEALAKFVQIFLRERQSLGAEDLSGVDRDFIDQSARRERKARARARRVQALVYVLLVGIILGLIGLINRAYIEEQVNWYWTMRPYMVAQVVAMAQRLRQARRSGG